MLYLGIAVLGYSKAHSVHYSWLAKLRVIWAVENYSPNPEAQLINCLKAINVSRLNCNLQSLLEDDFHNLNSQAIKIVYHMFSW